MHATKMDILFQQHELPSMEVQNQHDPLIIFITINKKVDKVSYD